MTRTVFNFENDGKLDLFVLLEPEGAEFRLPPGRSIEIHLIGATKPVLFRQATDADGRPCISIWPEIGEYEVKFEGKDIWDCL
jgi:hypothetical protein